MYELTGGVKFMKMNTTSRWRVAFNVALLVKPIINLLICLAIILPIAVHSYQLAPHKPGAKIKISEQSVAYIQAGVATELSLHFSVAQMQGYLRLRLNTPADGLSVIDSNNGLGQQWVFDLSVQPPELNLTLLGQHKGRPALIFVAELFDTRAAAVSVTEIAVSSRVLGVSFTVGDEASEAANKLTAGRSTQEKPESSKATMRYLPAIETLTP